MTMSCNQRFGHLFFAILNLWSKTDLLGNWKKVTYQFSSQHHLDGPPSLRLTGDLLSTQASAKEEVIPNVEQESENCTCKKVAPNW